MLFRLRNRHFFLIDALFCALIPIFALSLRLSFSIPTEYLPILIIYTLTALLIKLPVFYYLGLYRRFWLHASVEALVSISLAVFIAMILVTGLFFVVQGVVLFARPALPRSIPLIDGILTLVVVGLPRFSIRAIAHYKYPILGNEKTKRVLIAGAGDAGQMVAREIQSSKYVSVHLFGFVDDDPEKIGTTVHGVRVWGSLKAIPVLVREYNLQEVIIVMPTASGDTIGKVVNACEEAGISSKILPGVFKLLSGQAHIDRLRDVEIVDLLRREPVRIDFDPIVQLLTNKRVLVTGAGGSIGSEMCLQIANCSPARLVVLGRGENSLFALRTHFEKIGFNFPNLDFILADIRDPLRLESVFSRFRPDIVFHAAAHKHVSLMEAHVEEAVTNNILGTWNLAQAAKKYDVEKFVFISTDKAVKPISVMGMTKRMAELIVRMAAAETNRPYISVRFGNALGSRSSVIPLFQRQIAMGGPVTVTHPEVARCFMTIPDAVHLVLHASVLGRNGEVFVLDMGEPTMIADLARDMIEFSGREVDREIKIVYTGLRPGERLHEYLFADDEDYTRTEHEKIFVTRNGQTPIFDEISLEMKALERLANAGLTEELRSKLKQLVE